MNYWLDLFTGRTWKEFQGAGAGVSGFRESNWNRARDIKPGDNLLCYMVGLSRWVGLLEVTSERFRDSERIFSEEEFPVRFRVKPLVMLTPENGVPMSELRGRLSFYPHDMKTSKWSGHVRNSPTRYKESDGQAVAEAVRNAETNPVARPVDTKKLQRSSNLYKIKVKSAEGEIERIVSIPPPEMEENDQARKTKEETNHTEIQWRLLDLGSALGLDVWAPRRDRGKSWKGRRISAVKGLRDRLPPQFDANTNRIIEEIDVLWLNGQSIAAAFEVEHSTSIYSGLLRMSDLLTMQPNITISLYIVAPDDKYEKFEAEVARPTFAARERPLHTLCSFLPYSKLCGRLKEASSVLRYLKPEFLDEIASRYMPEEDMG